MSHEIQVTFDCADPGALAVFWAELLDAQVQPPPPGFATWEQALDAWGVPAGQRNTRSAVVPRDGEDGPRLFFQQVPEPKTVKNRVHLDVRAAPGLEGAARMAALEERADAVVARGGSRLRRTEPGEDMSAGFLVMTDPEGNEFCLD